MGGGGTPATTTVQNTTTSQSSPPTAQELELQNLELERRRASQPNLLAVDQNLFQLLAPLSRGQAPGGMFSNLGQGISEAAQQNIVNKALKATNPQFENLGLTDSGVKLDLQSRLAADIGTQAELAKMAQIESLFSALFGANVQANAPITSSADVLMNSLSAGRGFTSQSSGTQTTTQPRRSFFGLF